MFDWTISTGNLLQVAASVGTIMWMFLSMRTELRIFKNDLLRVEQQISTLNNAFTQLSNILTQVAVQDNRLHMVEKNIDELRHGKGFIVIGHPND